MRPLERPLGALRRTGELALSALSSLPEMSVLVFDDELRLVLAAGDSLAGHGWEPAAMEGRLLSEVVTPQLFASFEPRYRAVLRGERQGVEYTSIGGTRTYDIQLAPIEVDGDVVGGLVISRDISERRRAEAARALADEHFRTAFEDAPIGMALVAPDGHWLQVNPALCAIIGYTRDELQARTFQEVTHPADLDADVACVEQVLAGERSSYQTEKRYLRADGSVVWVLLAVSLVTDADGRPLHFIAQVQDIAERKRLERELRELATRDDVTGLCNRRHFEEQLIRQLERTRRHQEPAALLLLDLDDFKSINDTFGHAGGDEVLRHVARLLGSRVRASDVVARLGGDEFAILLSHADERCAGQVARAVDELLVAQPASLDGVALPAAASIGLVSIDGTLAEHELLARADRDMYRVKRMRRRPPTEPRAA